MDSYIIFISLEISTLKDIINGLQCRYKKFVSDYKNQQIVFTHEDSTASQSRTVKIIDFVDFNTFHAENIVWKDLYTYSFDVSNPEDDETKNQDHLTSNELSECLYKLADSLPPPGSCHVDIIWQWKEIDFKICDNLKLYGSLKRFISWHNGYLYVIQDSGGTIKDSNEWIEMLGGEIVTNSYLAETYNPRLMFWRGSVSLYDKHNEISQTLFGFHLVSELDNLVNGNIFANGEDGDMNNTIYFSSNMEIVSECDINSVPIYIITPNTYKLTVKSNSPLRENSTVWLKKFNSQAKLGLIVRLHYSTSLTLDNDSCFSPTTESWKNVIKNLQVNKISLPHLGKHTQQLNFLMVGDGSCLQNVKLHLLQTSYPLLGFLNERLGIQAKIMEISRDAADTWLPTLEALPYYDTECIADALAVVKEVQSNVLTYWKAKLDEGDDLPEINSENIRHVFVKARQKVLEKLIDQSTKALSLVNVINEKTQPRVYAPEVLQKSDKWPERLSLRNIDYEEGVLSKTSLLDLVSDNGKYFLMCFDKNGNAKTKRKLSKFESNTQSRHASKSNSEEPNFPDIHYSNDTENVESTENDVNFYQTKYIPDETASISSSTVKRVRLRPRISSDTSDKNLLRRSPRVKKCSQNSSSAKAVTRTMNESNNTIQSFTPASVKIQDSKKISKTVEIKNSKKKTNHRRHNSIQKSAVNDIVNTISEHHKMKLRIAVYDALEEHGIARENPIFNACGKRLFSICRTFAPDIVAGSGRTSEQMKLIANSHVKQVIDFESQIEPYRRKSLP